MRSALIVLALAALTVRDAYGFQIEAMKHDIQLITEKNFDGVIGKFRDSAVSSLWFFKGDNAADKTFLDEYNNVAKELKGMMKICAIDCNEWPKFCKNNKVETTPAVMVYPSNPVPNYLFTGKLEKKALVSRLAKLLTDNSLVITKDNIDAFLTSDATKPKILLFSSAAKPSMVWKAMTSETVLKRTIKFGFVKESEADIVSRFKVKKFPTFLAISGGKADKKEFYKGAMTFTDIKDWVNLRSESGMGDKIKGAGGKESEEPIEESKPWLVQEVPELTAKSQKDICFKNEGLCVIYLKEGALTPAETDMLTSASKKFTSQLSDRGTKLKFMWLDLKIEGNYKDLFAPESLPSAVVFNPHKRLRFTKMEGEMKGDAAGIAALLDKVLGGDARFKMVPGQKLPSWAAREEKKKTEL